ncbi:Zn-dependent protease [Sphingomonas sp. UYAg733]
MNDPNIIYTIAVWLIPLIIAIVFHEVAHGYVARIFGDRTAEQRGRLSLNPIRHVDPIGTLVVPLVLALAHAPIFGWAKPVPVVARRLRNPRVHMMLVALAGPATNLFLAALAAALLGGTVAMLGGVPDGYGATRFVVDNLLNFLMINVFLAIFNLIPLPPFDGGHVVEGLLPRSLAVQYSKLARFGFPLLLFLIVILPAIAPGADVVGRVVTPIAQAVVGFFLRLAQLGV